MKRDTLFIVSCSVALRTRHVSDKIVENIKTHILCSLTFCFLENRTVYEIMWKNAVQLQTPQTTIKHGACVLHSGELRLHHKLRICNTYWFCKATIVPRTRTRLNVTFKLYCLSCCICSFVEMKQVSWAVPSWRMWRTLNLTCTQDKYEQTYSPTSMQPSVGSSNEDADTAALSALSKTRKAEEKST